MEYIQKTIHNAKNIVITAHKSPDGDAIGSTLALYHYLKSLDKNVTSIVPDEFPSFLNWMDDASSILCFNKKTEQANQLIDDADLIFSLDYNGLARIGEMSEIVGRSKAIKIVVDHHPNPEDFADYYFVDVHCSSTAEMIFNFIEKLNHLDKITPTIGACIYCGIMTDTGSFRFSSTAAKTHQIAAHIIQLGVDTASIHQKVYDNTSVDKLKLIGYALTEKMQVFPNQETAYISLSKNELKKFQFKKGDTEGLVNYPLSISGIKRSVLITEKNNEIRFSFRSKDKVYVNELANQYFNGGGHIYAAGGMLKTSLNEAIDKLHKVLELK